MAFYDTTDALYGTGAYGSASYGIVQPEVAITGVSATGTVESVAAGGFEVDISERLGSVSAIGSIGSVEVILDTAFPDGVSATGSAGSVFVNLTEALNSVSSTGFAGTPSVNINEPITGVAATGSAHPFGRVVSINRISVVGVVAAGSIGTLSENVDEPLSSVSASGTIGTVSLNISESITGVEGELNPLKPFTASGDAQLSTAEKKFGTASLLLDGTDDFVTSDENIDLSSGDFTVDMWIRPTSVTGYKGLWESGTSSILNVYLIGNQVQGVVGGSTTLFLSSTRISANVWTMISVEREGNVHRLYINGTLEASSSTGNRPDNGVFAVGKNGFGDFNGYIDETRVSTVARYSGSSFTEPTAAFSLDTDTTALLHFDGANGSTTITNAASNVINFTLTGTANTTLIGVEAVGSVNNVEDKPTEVLSSVSATGFVNDNFTFSNSHALTGIQGTTALGTIVKTAEVFNFQAVANQYSRARTIKIPRAA